MKKSEIGSFAGRTSNLKKREFLVSSPRISVWASDSEVVEEIWFYCSSKKKRQKKNSVAVAETKGRTGITLDKQKIIPKKADYFALQRCSQNGRYSLIFLHRISAYQSLVCAFFFINNTICTTYTIISSIINVCASLRFLTLFRTVKSARPLLLQLGNLLAANVWCPRRTASLLELRLAGHSFGLATR